MLLTIFNSNGFPWRRSWKIEGELLQVTMSLVRIEGGGEGRSGGVERRSGDDIT